MENDTLPIDGAIAGFRVPVRRALTEPIFLGGAPRSIAILNGTLFAAAELRFGSDDQKIVRIVRSDGRSAI